MAVTERMAPGKYESTVTPEIVERYKKLTTPNIWQVLTTQGINCYTRAVRAIAPGMRLCGPAVTMRLVPIQEKKNFSTIGSPDFEHTIHVLSRMTKKGDIHVLDMGGYMDGSLFGGHAAADAKWAGAAGMVIDGVTRDSYQQIEWKFPVFARDTVAPHAHGMFRTANLNNEPVVVGTVSIGPGDLVIGDNDGLCVVPKDRAADLLPLIEEAEERDYAGVKDWDAGLDVHSKDGGHHQNSLDVMDPKMITNVPKGARDPRTTKRP